MIGNASVVKFDYVIQSLYVVLSTTLCTKCERKYIIECNPVKTLKTGPMGKNDKTEVTVCLQ